MPRTKKEKPAEEKVTEAKATKTTKTTKTTRSRAKKPQVDVFVEYNNVQTSIQEIIDNVTSTYAANENQAEIKTLKIYVKPDENAAYFVVNETDSYKMDVFFC